MARRPKMSRQSFQAFRETSPGELMWDLLTFDRLLTGPVIHLIYWAGLAILVLLGFSVVGAAVGVALREPGMMGWILALPTLVIGFLGLAAGALVWRSFCELYVAAFRIADDLRVRRAYVEQDHAGPRPARPQTAALVEDRGPQEPPREDDLLSRI